MRPLLLLAALSGLLLNSCFSAGDGQEPPLQSLYFPTGLTLDTVSTDSDGAAKYLYVASSDFDLQYRSSALASYDLARVRQVVPRSCTAEIGCALGEHCDTEPSEANGNVPSYFCLASAGDPPCGVFGDRSSADRLLNPGRCTAVDPVHPKDDPASPLLHDTVGIGAFATDLIFRANLVGTGSRFPARLFLPVRGDATLHWIDLADGKFNCGQGSNSDHSCDGLHRSGDVSSDNNDQLRQQSEPFAVDATLDGTSVAVTNQTTGTVSLYVTPPESWSDGPKLASVLGGLPQAPVAIAAIPKPDKGLYPDGQSSVPGFLVAYRNAAQVDLLRARTDPKTGVGAASYTRYALLLAGSVPITTNSIGFDSRGIVIDDEERLADYANCATGDRDCLLKARQPKVYVANRTPASLLVGSMIADYGYTAGTSELPAFIDSVPLTAGASRVVLGHVKVPSSAAGALSDDGGAYAIERRVFVVCFDSRRVFVYDPKRRTIEAVISTGRGPYALAIDDARGLGYVAHFTDSYLGVISLDQRFPQTYATIVASIGTPSPPRSSK